jgi:hypothetical protein
MTSAVRTPSGSVLDRRQHIYQAIKKMNHSASQAFEGTDATQAQAELLRRALLVQKALALLARLKTIQAIGSGNKAFQLAKPSALASNSHAKLSLVILLDADALVALLNDLEVALVDCSALIEPDSYAAGVVLVNEFAVHGKNSRLKFLLCLN